MTIKQERFIRELPTSKSVTEAAIKAGYSPHTAQQIATENLSKPVIRDRIAALLKESQTDKHQIAANSHISLESDTQKHTS